MKLANGIGVKSQLSPSVSSCTKNTSLHDVIFMHMQRNNTEFEFEDMTAPFDLKGETII